MKSSGQGMCAQRQTTNRPLAHRPTHPRMHPPPHPLSTTLYLPTRRAPTRQQRFDTSSTRLPLVVSSGRLSSCRATTSASTKSDRPWLSRGTAGKGGRQGRGQLPLNAGWRYSREGGARGELQACLYSHTLFKGRPDIESEKSLIRLLDCSVIRTIKVSE